MKKVSKLVHALTIRAIPSGYESGIVVAGFGKDEIYPSLVSFVVDGKGESLLRCWPSKSHTVNDGASASVGAILPFAQTDIFALFMEGIMRTNLRFIETMLSKIMDERISTILDRYVHSNEERLVEKSIQMRETQESIKSILTEFSKFRQESQVQKILQVVEALPKEEMAAMAEALVELTSLRRKVDSPLESVGGPVDVAVISKGDGFVWIKRKHYFDLAINRDFLYRKALRIGKDGPAE